MDIHVSIIIIRKTMRERKKKREGKMVRQDMVFVQITYTLVKFSVSAIKIML